MSTFDRDKLYVEYMNGVTATKPVISRRYTLTHSDLTGELFLNIGFQYAWEKTNALRDEVLGEWKMYGSSLIFCVYVYVDQGEFPPSLSAKRTEIFRRELPLALTAIRYGDRHFFHAFPHLDQVPIIINFMSAYPQFLKQENGGIFQDFIS